MKILKIQDVYQNKFGRQKKIKELELHAAGHCAHLGRISPGCYACFVPDRHRLNINVGRKCNLDCSYCATGGKAYSRDSSKNNAAQRVYLARTIGQITMAAREPGYRPSAFSFTGGGEPLLHLDVIDSFMPFLKEIHKKLPKKPWYYLYTNGLLASRKVLLHLKELGLDEIRFHLGASNFSEKVYENMQLAAGYFKAVSVETPAWPFHRKKLFEMLPRIERIGVKHLNITEVELNKYNFKRIARMLPKGKICQCGELQLYDDGLVYDLMEEVVRKKYTYSVLDCNCFVKNIQRTGGKTLFHENVKGLCAEYR